jgi:hypothetical protein
MASIRRVTRKPPTMLMVAIRTDSEADSATTSEWPEPTCKQCAEHHDAGDGVGHRHQRRVQGMADAPDHLEADKACQGKDDEVGHEARRRIGAHQRDQQASSPRAAGYLGLGLALKAAASLARFSSGVRSLRLLLGFVPRSPAPWAAAADR